MVTAITQGVKVSVLSEYQPEHSSPWQSHFVFSYKIRVENQSDYTVQLLRRHWHIFDSNGSYREVEGEGVIGQQPVLEPGDSFQYMSGAVIRTDMGRMVGNYQMENMLNKKANSINYWLLIYGY